MKALKTATGGFYNDLISVRSPLVTLAKAFSILKTTFGILKSITALILLLRLNILKL